MDITQEMIGILMVIITGTIVPFVIRLINKQIAKIEQTVSENRKDFYIYEVVALIRDVVAAANQTVVDELKKGGEFTKERQVEIFNEVFNRIMSLISTEALKMLNVAFGDAEAWIKNKIEVTVRELKR